MRGRILLQTHGTEVSNGGTFPTTHWTVLGDAADTRSPGQAVALESLCRAYWTPVHAYVTTLTGSPDGAKDLTQGFFAHLLENRALAAAQRERGRFRTFLLTSLRNHLTNQHKHAQRLKRMPREGLIPLEDLSEAELDSLRHDESPEREFERKWAKAVVNRVLDRLKAECAAAGQSDRFDSFKLVLADGPQAEASAIRLAAGLGLTEGAFRMALHRFRLRYRELFRVEIASQVSDLRDIEEEIRHVLTMLRG
jgi:RNA polymerase sigma-70 factor (ECF subfamily)